MLKKNILAIITLMIIGVCLLSGCNTDEETADSVLLKMNNAFKEADSFLSKADMVLEFDYTLEEINSSMLLNYKDEITTLIDSKEYYLEGNMYIEGVYNDEWKTYVVNRGGEYASYTCTDDEWYFDFISDDDVNSGAAVLGDILSGVNGYTLEIKMDYVLETWIKYDDVSKILGAFYSNILEDAFSEGINTSEISAKLTVNINKRTYLPEKLELVFDDCAEAFTGEGLFDAVTMKQFVFKVTMSKFGDKLKVAVPEDVVEMFVIPGEDDETGLVSEPVTFEGEEDVEQNLEGYYELYDYEDQKMINIKAPEGFELNIESDASIISFDKDRTDGYCSASYEFLPATDENKVEIENETQMVYEFYSTDDDYSQMEYTGVGSVDIGGRTVVFAGIKYYYAGSEFSPAAYTCSYNFWTYIDDYMLVCKVADLSTDGFTEFNAEEMAGLLFGNIK